jgi:hypothetical protein
MSSASNIVVLRGGVSVPLPAFMLALDLENRGFTLDLDTDESLLVGPGARLTDEDRAAIQGWREDLKRIIRYCDTDGAIA